MGKISKVQYLGGKVRIAKQIAEFLKTRRKKHQPFVDLFFGGGAISNELRADTIANDIHKQLIALHVEVKKNGVRNLPDFVSEEEYNIIRDYRSNYPDYILGFVGFCCTFGGKYFAGYARSRGDNFAKRGKIALDSVDYSGITFTCGSYDQLQLPKNSLIYCDPPYFDTTKYASTDDFNHNEFWAWCRQRAYTGHTVLVSEFEAPADFTCVLEIERTVQMSRNKKLVVDKLFELR